jgi:hypothetical protein
MENGIIFIRYLFPALRSQADIIHNLYMFSKGPISDEVSLFFWAGLLPTLWLALYTAATILTRGLITVAPVFSFVLRYLDVEERPIQVIGIVAALIISVLIAVFALLAKMF